MIRIAPRVLVVDDLPDAADTLSALLNLCGFDSESQISGEAALGCAARRRPAIVLIDLRMPTMDGFEFVRRFRELDGCRQTPVVVISGYKIEESCAQARILGVDRFFAKPVEIDALLTAMKGVLNMPFGAIRNELAFPGDHCEGCDVLACRKVHDLVQSRGCLVS